jgi:hypothetical protein
MKLVGYSCYSGNDETFGERWAWSDDIEIRGLCWEFGISMRTSAKGIVVSLRI